MIKIQINFRQELIDRLKGRKIALDAWTEYCAELSEALSLEGSPLSVGAKGEACERAIHAAYRSGALDKEVILSWDIYEACATYEELADLLLKYHNEGRLLEHNLQKP